MGAELVKSEMLLSFLIFALLESDGIVFAMRCLWVAKHQFTESEADQTFDVQSVRRKGVLFITCKKNGKHKQRQGK